MSLFSKMDSPARSSNRALGIQIIRTFGIFQAIMVTPIALFLGLCAFASLILPIASLFVYISFVSSLLTFLLSASVAFVIVAELRIEGTARQTFKFEVIKSALATALWLGLLIDTLIWPYQEVKDLGVDIPGVPQQNTAIYLSELKVLVDEIKRERVEKTAITVIILFLLFYPSLVYSYILSRRDKEYRDPGHTIQLEDRDTTPNNEEEGLLERVD